VLVTNVFSPAVAGAFFSATSLFLIVEAVASLGAFTGAVYFIARLRLLGEESRINIILRAAIIPVVVVSVVGTVLLLLFANPLAGVLLGGHLGTAERPRRRWRRPCARWQSRCRSPRCSTPCWAPPAATATCGHRGHIPARRSVTQLIGRGGSGSRGSAALLAPLWAVPYIPAAIGAWMWLRWIRRHQSSGSPREPSRQNSPPCWRWRPRCARTGPKCGLARPTRTSGWPMRTRADSGGSPRRRHRDACPDHHPAH